jgi:hypothetical protein
MGLFNKKDVPDELPELAIDEVEQKNAGSKKVEVIEQSQQVSQDSKPVQVKQINSPQSYPQLSDFSNGFSPKQIVSPSQQTNNQVQNSSYSQQANSQEPSRQPFSEGLDIENSAKEKFSERMKRGMDDKGYFQDVINSLTSELDDINKFEDWYKQKFVGNDGVIEMKQYWKKQRPEAILANVKYEVKEKVLEKTNKLSTLEKEWQDIYFSLVSKEEEIRKQESELKTLLSDFVESYKKMLGEDRFKDSEKTD